MTDRLLPFRLFNDDGELTTAAQIGVDNTNNATSAFGSNSQAFSEAIAQRANQLASLVSSSSRPFQRVNTDLVINNTNLATHNDRNTIYAAGVDKNVVWRLPSEAAITASGISYPIEIEVTHIGGITANGGSTGDRNRIEITIAGGTTERLDVIGGAQNAERFFMFQDDVALIVKEQAGEDWQVQLSRHDPSTVIRDTGLVDIREQQIQNINSIETELTGVTINQGYLYIVESTGTRFGHAFQSGDAIIALINNPSLAANSEDWLIVSDREGALSNDQALLLSNFSRSGNRFAATRNVFVDEANVIAFSSQASGTPLQLAYFDSNGDGVPTQRQFTSQAIQFSDLQGGTLSLSIVFAASQQSGFLPELTDIVFNFGGTSFAFPLVGVDPQAGLATVDITIPNNDYTGILNTNCDITLNFVFRGATFIGTFTVMGLVNTLNGPLRQSVTDIANTSSLMAEQRVGNRIDSLANDVDNDGAALQAIQPRISPLKSVTTNSPDVNALFLDSTGTDSFPADLATMSQVSAQNPRFTGGDTSLYVAVISPGSYALRNITTSSDTALADSDPAVTLGESRTLNNNTYFVYRVTGLTSGHVYEVERQSVERVVAWPDDIRNLQDDVSRIDAELTHAALSLPSALIHVLENEVTVTEEATPTTIVTEYNEQLAGPSNTTQTVYRETSPNSPSGGALNSKPISDTSGTARARRKLVYLPAGIDYQNQAYLTAFDGTTGRDLIRYTNGVFKAQVFVPAIPASTRIENVYPAPANRVSGAGIWQNIPTLTFQNGVPTPEADELFFTRNIPSSPTTLTIQYRGHANGNVFGENTGSLTGVGGSSEAIASFTLNDGSESVTIEVRWYPAARQIRVSATERVYQGLPTINDVEVILSYSESRTVPATPDTTREVDIEFEHPGGQVFAIKPSDNANLVIVGDRQEIDTGFAYSTLFGAGEGGHLIALDSGAAFFDYQDFEPIAATVTNLENHSGLPQFGLFSTQYTRETDLNIGVTIKPTGFNVGDLPTSTTGLTSGDLWNNAGVLTIVP